MENYLINDYINSQKGNNSRTSIAESRRKKKAIDLFENKHIGIKEIASILEVSVKTVKEVYLRENRIRNVAVELFGEGMEINQIANVLDVDESVVKGYLDSELAKRASTDKNKEDEKTTPKKIKSKKMPKRQKLTPRRVDNLVAQRDELIKCLYGEGFTIAEVADRMRLTIDQAKERYSFLGLSIYTPEELAKMRAEDIAKREEEKKKRAKEKRRIRDRKRREIQKEQQAEEEKEEQEPKEEESSDEITSFTELKRKMFELTKEGKSRKAATLAREYIAYGKFLNPKEIKKLRDMVDFIDLMHSEERKYKNKTRDDYDR